MFEILENRASRVRQLERRALLMFADLLLRLRLTLNEDIGLGRVEIREVGRDGGAGAGQA